MAEEKTQPLSSKTNTLNLGNWISKGWDIVIADIGLFLLVSFIYLVIIAIATSIAIPVIFLYGPLTVGFYFIILEKMRGKPINIGDITKGFNFFLASFLSSILIGIFIGIGSIFCIIPGFVIAALYLFTPLFIVEKNLDFWEAMEASRKVVRDHIFEMTILVLLLLVFSLVGIIACGVGIIFTTPWILAITAVAYDDMVGIKRE